MLPWTAGWTPIIHGVHMKPSALPLCHHEAEVSVATNGSTTWQKRNGIAGGTYVFADITVLTFANCFFWSLVRYHWLFPVRNRANIVKRARGRF
jgi:hypothetical protein